MNNHKESIDFLIIPPTYEELIEVQKFLPNARKNKSYSDGSIKFTYDEGITKLQDQNFTYRVISPSIPGHSHVRDSIEYALNVWAPKLVILVGVAGGFKDQGVHIGDILLPRIIYIHERSKLTHDDNEPRPDFCMTTEYFVDIVKRFFDRSDWDEEISTKYFKYLLENLDDVKCHADGNIISSNLLVAKNLDERDVLKRFVKFDTKIYGIEQEAGGIGKYLYQRTIPWVDIRVVMDEANPETRTGESKDKNKQQASEIAAKFIFAFIEWYLPEFSKLFPEITSFNVFTKYHITTLLKGQKSEPFRSIGPQLIDFEKGDWVYIPSIANDVFEKIQRGKIVIIGGKAATGKSVISRYIGYKSLLENNSVIYYIDFLNLIERDIIKVLDNLDNIIAGDQFNNLKISKNCPLLIFENVHDPRLNQFQILEKNFVPYLKSLKGKVKILLTTRGDLTLFSGIEEGYVIDLNEMHSLNEEIINGILTKYNQKRKENGVNPIEWKISEIPENLWLLGWFLRATYTSPLTNVKFLDFQKINEKMRIDIETYYERNFPEHSFSKIIAILLIISLFSRYETSVEEDFIIRHAISEYAGLDSNNTSQIIQLLRKKKEILSKEIIDLEDMTHERLEVRIPHIKLAEIIQDNYLNESNKEKCEKIFQRYVLNGINTDILGQNLWLRGEYKLAIKYFKLVRAEKKVIKRLLKYYKMSLEASNNHIHSLDLSDNSLSYIPKKLHKFSELKYLYLHKNQITEIRGLDNLPNLQRLNLMDNQISEIKGLESLQNFEDLTLSNNQITEIKELEKLPRLQKLFLNNNQISEIKGLESLQNLEFLALFNNQITEIKGLEKLPNLQILFLDNNQITEIKGLEKLTNLYSLLLNGNQITEIKGLEKLTNLHSLLLEGNQISEIKGLESLRNLEFLALFYNQITEIKGLEKLFNLQSLFLYGNQITEIKGLKHLKNLELLNLEFNEITEIKGLEKLFNLQSLFLNGNQISEIKGLEKLPNLLKLFLYSNQITEIKGLENLTNLRDLNLNNNPINEEEKDLLLLSAEKVVKYCQKNKEVY